MKKIFDFKPSYLVFSSQLGQLFAYAIQFKDDAILLKNSTTTCTTSFHLLSTVALELLPKLLIGYDICLKYKSERSVSVDEIRTEIAKNITKFGHDIEALYNNFPGMLQALNIEKIEKIQNGRIWEYPIKLRDEERWVSIKDVEAARYGVFAKNMDIATFCTEDHIIIDLLNKVTSYVRDREIETNKELVKFQV